jgi:DNA-binding MarR family transcriptional regulator
MLQLIWQGEAHDRMHQVCRSIEIPASMIKSLMQLSEDEPRPMRELAETWACDASYVTALVDNLEERGFAERRPHPTDRRVKTVVLTPKGAEVRQLVTSRLYEPPPAFSALTAAEQRQLRDLLAKVARADATLGWSRRGVGV